VTMKRGLAISTVVMALQFAPLPSGAQAPGYPLEEQDRAATALCCANIMSQEYANMSGQEVDVSEGMKLAETFYCGGDSCSKHDRDLLKATQQHLKDGRWNGQKCTSDECRSRF